MTMMPDLPEPLETLLWEALLAAQDQGVAQARTREDGSQDSDYVTRTNHAAFEAERALRLAILQTLRPAKGT